MSLQRDIAAGVLRAEVVKPAAVFFFGTLLGSPVLLFAAWLALTPGYVQKNQEAQKGVRHAQQRVPRGSPGSGVRRLPRSANSAREQ